MLKGKIPLLLRLNKLFTITHIITIFSLAIVIISMIIGIVGLILRNFYLELTFTGILFIIIPLAIYFGIPKYLTYIRVKKLFNENNETALIKLSQKSDMDSILALIALYDLKSKEFKPLFSKHLASDKFKSGLEQLLTTEIFLEENFQ
ncbi:MAG: hypothetical protein JXA54_15985 [Candidatus Heimdallarchaeota archaeon]|nr:hypothetical protein [Candidatus Heimdallarchaeota archaeon]